MLNNGKAALRILCPSIIDLFGISFNHCATPVRLQCVCLLHVAISKGLSLIFVMIKTQHHIATATLRLTRVYSSSGSIFQSVLGQLQHFVSVYSAKSFCDATSSHCFFLLIGLFCFFSALLAYHNSLKSKLKCVKDQVTDQVRQRRRR